MLVSDVVLETVRAVVVVVILTLMIAMGRRHDLSSVPGWRPMTIGFALILLGCIFDITDEFDALKRFVIIGPTPAEAFIEKVVGFLAGFILIAWALWKLQPAVTAARQSAVTLRSSLDATEQQLAETAHILEALTSRSFLMIFIHREKLLYANQVLCEFLGYTPAELTRMKMRDLVHPSQRSILDRELEHDQSTSNGVPYKHVLWMLAKDGRERWVQMTSMRTKFEGGPARLCVAIDITEQKALSRQLQTAQKMESLGIMAGGIAHDFNNYLTTLLGNIGILNMMQPSAQEQKILKLMEEACISATDMVRQLLGFSRKSPVGEQNPLELTTVVDSTLKLAQVSIPEDIRLQREIVAEAMPVHGDASQLQQALLNLLLNARDASEESENPEISLHLDTIPADELPKPLPALESGGRACRIIIRDNGCGIDPENLVHIFEPFFTTKGPMHGTGLGLAMVYGTIQDHHGFIEVDSRPDEGTSFRIYLPLMSTTDPRLRPSPSTPPEQVLSPQANNETILLVDDNALVRQTTRNVLETLGYNVFEAENGEQALRMFKQHRDQIQILISDIVMPVMDGVSLANEVRQLHPQLPVILATGYDRDAYLANITDKKSIKLIGKPYRIHELSALIRKMLDG